MLLKSVLLYWVIIFLYYINLKKYIYLILHLLFCCVFVFVLYVCIVFIPFLFQNFRTFVLLKFNIFYGFILDNYNNPVNNMHTAK